MSIKTVIEAASALRETQDKIDKLQSEKNAAQAQIAQINADLVPLQAEKAQRIATLKTEAGTI